MAEYINIAPREHVEKRVTMVAKPGDAYSESTGNRETTKYTGTWEEMLAQATGLIGGGGGSVQVTCEIERLEGGIGELTVTVEEFRQPEAGESAGDDTTGGGGGGESPGDSENSPVCTVSSSLVQVCILAHPKFALMEEWERRALKAMIDGQDENSLIEGDESGPDGAPVMKRIKDCIGSDAAKKAFDYISRGVVFWNDVSVEATLRWRGRSNRYSAGEIVSTLPGGPSAVAGRNWLCSGTGTEKTGSVTWCTASFRLSGVGGWDGFLYSEK